MKVGIAGMGRRGLRHLLAAAKLSGGAPIRGYDPFLSADEIRARGAEPVVDFDEFCDTIDLAVIACQHGQLAPVALAALSRGRHCLVEKPGAMSLGDARDLTEQASRSNVLLAFGFVERFHILAQRAIARIAAAPRPCLVRLVRHGGRLSASRSSRDLVDDLMVHDIDFMIRAIQATGGPDPSALEVRGFHAQDFASILVSAGSGLDFVIECSRGIFPPARCVQVSTAEDIQNFDLYRGVHETRTRIESSDPVPPGLFRELYANVTEIALESDSVLAQMLWCVQAVAEGRIHQESVVAHREIVERICESVAA